MDLNSYIKQFYKKTSEKEHANNVLKFANLIFDKIAEQKEYNFLLKYKNCLEVASLLHDIGINIENGEHHAKRGAKFILDNGIDGLKDEEIKIVSSLIKYHKGKKPKKKHLVYASCDKETRNVIKALSAILQVADLIDFAHISYVEDIKFELNQDTKSFVINTVPNISRLKEFEEAKIKKSCLFEKFYSLTLYII